MEQQRHVAAKTPKTVWSCERTLMLEPSAIVVSRKKNKCDSNHFIDDYEAGRTVSRSAAVVHHGTFTVQKMGFTAISQEPMAGFWSSLVFSITRRVSNSLLQKRNLVTFFPNFQGHNGTLIVQKMNFTAISQEPMDGFWSCLVFSIIRRVTIAERNLVTLT